MKLIAILALAFLPSCLTAGELERIQYGVAELRETVQDRESTFADIGSAVDRLALDLEEIEESVDERTRGFISAGEAGAGGTGLVGLGLLALNAFRNSQRRRRSEPV